MGVAKWVSRRGCREAGRARVASRWQPRPALPLRGGGAKAYKYGSESKLLELPNPYRLQNLLQWICAALLVAAGPMCLALARGALQDQALRLVAAPLAAVLAMLLAGVGCAAVAARRLRFYFGRGRPVSLAVEIPPGATGGSLQADEVKRDLRQGALSYAEPSGPIGNLLYRWVPTLITAPERVQDLAQRTAFNLAAALLVLLSFVLTSLVFGNDTTRPWISIIYFVLGLFYLVRPVLSEQRARIGTLGLVGLIAAAVLAPVALGLLGPQLPPLGRCDADHADLRAPTPGWPCGCRWPAARNGRCDGSRPAAHAAELVGVLPMVAALSQVDPQPQTRVSVEQLRLSMNAPPATLMDELDRTLQSQRSERIPNHRYARIDPVVAAATPAGGYAHQPCAGAERPSGPVAHPEQHGQRFLRPDRVADRGRRRRGQRFDAVWRRHRHRLRRRPPEWAAPWQQPQDGGKGSSGPSTSRSKSVATWT